MSLKWRIIMVRNRVGWPPAAYISNNPINNQTPQKMEIVKTMIQWSLYARARVNIILNCHQIFVFFVHSTFSFDIIQKKKKKKRVSNIYVRAQTLWMKIHSCKERWAGLSAPNLGLHNAFVKLSVQLRVRQISVGSRTIFFPSQVPIVLVIGRINRYEASF